MASTLVVAERIRIAAKAHRAVALNFHKVSRRFVAGSAVPQSVLTMTPI
jgi:hypothetical protein